MENKKIKINKENSKEIISILKKPIHERKNFDISQIIDFFEKFNIFEVFPKDKGLLMNLTKNITFKIYYNNNIILEEGNYNKNIYFIIDGVVSKFRYLILKNDIKTKYFPEEVIECYILNGETFGEISASNFLKSSHNFRSKDTTYVAIINLEVINEFYKNRIKEQKLNIRSNLEQMKFFSDLDTKIISKISKNLIIYRYPNKSLIIEQNNYIKEINILVTGQINVIRKFEKNNKEEFINIETIGEFGKILAFDSLYYEKKSQNSYVTNSPTYLLTMNYNDFKEIVDEEFLNNLLNDYDEYPSNSELFSIMKENKD